MALQDIVALVWRNYAFPTVYAAATAAATLAEQQLTRGQAFDAHAIEAAALVGAATFLASRLNPYTGKDQPVVAEHK